MWRYLKQGMAGRWHASRHEESCELGVPDVSYGCGGRCGWIELKSMDSWPSRPESIVRVRLKEHQRRWLKDRGVAGGSCWLLLRVGIDYLLIHHSRIDLVGESNRDVLTQSAHCYWRGRIIWGELASALAGFGS